MSETLPDVLAELEELRARIQELESVTSRLSITAAIPCARRKGKGGGEGPCPECWRLKAALARYGRHLLACAYETGADGFGAPCTCGLWAARG